MTADLPLPPEATALHGNPLSGAPSAENRMIQALRRLCDLAVGRTLAPERWARAAEQLEALAGSLEEAAGTAKRSRGQPDSFGHPQDLFPTSPVMGFANPLAPPVRVWAEKAEDARVRLRGRAFFGYAYEGPPTCVHGGVVAELFDELLGATNIMNATAGMTGTLTVRYRRPTPLMTPLDLEAHLVRVEGRKIYTHGEISLGGVVTAEADGIFVAVPPDQMLAIAKSHAAGAEGTVIDPGLALLIAASAGPHVADPGNLVAQVAHDDEDASGPPAP